MNPTNNPEFLQQILGLTPQPPEASTPIPFAEDDEINAKNQALAALDINNRVSNIDPFSRKKRSGSQGERTKMDKLGTGLSYLTEFLGAATGGPKYQNPWQRARTEAVEDYKLQAPRLIDELKILNQNKRAAQAEESRQKIAQGKIEAQLEIAKLQEQFQRFKLGQNLLSEKDKLDFRKSVESIRQRYSNDPLVKLKLQEFETDFKQLEQNPTLAGQISDSLRQDKNQNYLAQAYARRIGGQQDLRTAPTSKTVVDQYDPNIKHVLPGLSTSKVTSPLSPQEQQTANSLFGLGPVTPQKTNSLTQPESVTQPQTPQPVVPGLAGANNDVARRTLAKPKEQPAGPITPQRANPITSPEDSVAVDNKTSADYDNNTPLKTMRIQFGDVNKLQNQILGVQNIQGELRTPWGVINKRTFARKNGDKDRKEFMDNQRAVMDNNGLAITVMQHYIQTGGDLLTGPFRKLAVELDQKADNSIFGSVLKPGAKALAGRTITDKDRAIAFLTTKNYFDSVYAKTGMQANQFEFENAKQYNLHTELAPDQFMFRALVLTLAANKNMQRIQKELASGQVETNPELTIPWAVQQAEVIMDMLRKTKNMTPAQRQQILNRTDLAEALNPNMKAWGLK